MIVWDIETRIREQDPLKQGLKQRYEASNAPEPEEFVSKIH